MFSELIDQYRKELGEFVSVVKEDTSQVIGAAADTLQKLNKESATGSGARKSPQVPKDFGAFLEQHDFEGDAAFADFQASFDLGAREGQLAEARAQVGAELARFVPGELEEPEFWARFFFFQHIQRRARLLAGDTVVPEEEEEALSWGDDEEEEEVSEQAEDEAGEKEAEHRGEQRGTATALALAEERAAKAEAAAAQLQQTVDALQKRVEELEVANAKLLEQAAGTGGPGPAGEEPKASDDVAVAKGPSEGEDEAASSEWEIDDSGASTAAAAAPGAASPPAVAAEATAAAAEAAAAAEDDGDGELGELGDDWAEWE